MASYVHPGVLYLSVLRFTANIHLRRRCLFSTRVTWFPAPAFHPRRLVGRARGQHGPPLRLRPRGNRNPPQEPWRQPIREEEVSRSLMP